MAGLPELYQSQILALVEIAREECVYRAWEDIEPILKACWTETHPQSDLQWGDVAPFIRTAAIEATSQPWPS